MNNRQPWRGRITVGPVRLLVGAWPINGPGFTLALLVRRDGVYRRVLGR